MANSTNPMLAFLKLGGKKSPAKSKKGLPAQTNEKNVVQKKEEKIGPTPQKTQGPAKSVKNIKDKRVLNDHDGDD